MTLDKLKVGSSATILEVGATESLRQHLLDMGLIPGAVVTVTKFAPMGDPMQVLVHGYELTLRLSDAVNIKVSEAFIKDKEENIINKNIKKPHPGLGWKIS